jgi:NitT/TauT family transport system substrate-binding protein
MIGSSFSRLLCAALGSLTLLTPALALDKVNIGVANSSTDIGLFAAQKRGYFAQEGIEANFIAFDSAARMIAPFASGDLDVGGGGPSAGLYNAIARGIDIRIVAPASTFSCAKTLSPAAVTKHSPISRA